MVEFTEKEKLAMAAKMNNEYSQRTLAAFGGNGQGIPKSIPPTTAKTMDVEEEAPLIRPKAERDPNIVVEQRRLYDVSIYEKLRPLCKELVENWQDRDPFKIYDWDPKLLKIEKKIEAIAGKGAVFFTLSQAERYNYDLLARRIACLAKTRRGCGFMQYGFCRKRIS